MPIVTALLNSIAPQMLGNFHGAIVRRAKASDCPVELVLEMAIGHMGKLY
jgi:hypothetical protein